MIPVIISTRFSRLADPKEILPLIDRNHRGASMLSSLCAQYPRIFTERELMWVGQFKVDTMGPICAFTAFHFWILRINDRLPRTGWRINDTNNFRLEPISADQAAVLEQRLNRRAA